MNHTLALYNNSVQSLASIQQQQATTAASSNQSLQSLHMNQSQTALQLMNQSDATYHNKQYVTSPAECYTVPPTGVPIDVNQIQPTNHDTAPAVEEEPEPVIDIIINNVVCTFNTRCHLNLKLIAMEGMNVIYKRENGMVSMKIRNPPVTASIWSSGKITTTGSNSEATARESCRKVARCLQRLGFKIRFTSFRIVNVLGTCSFPFGIKMPEFARGNAQDVCYEPELHPGATYRIKEPKATLKIFSTGSVTVTAPSIDNVQHAIEHIYPLVYEYRADRSGMPSSLDPALLYEEDGEVYSGAQDRRGLKRRRDLSGRSVGSDSQSSDSD